MMNHQHDHFHIFIFKNFKNEFPTFWWDDENRPTDLQESYFAKTFSKDFQHFQQIFFKDKRSHLDSVNFSKSVNWSKYNLKNTTFQTMKQLRVPVQLEYT